MACTGGCQTLLIWNIYHQTWCSGRVHGPDFWRYQVVSKISGFDLESANISHENIACWLMREALNLGYPVITTARSIMIAISGVSMARDGRKGYADRLGKNITGSPYIDYWAFWPVMFRTGRPIFRLRTYK